MSSPTQTPPSPEIGFDPLVFWVKHQQKIFLFVGLFVAALAIYFLTQVMQSRRMTAASQALAAATTPDNWRQVIKDYEGTAAGGNAHLLLADQLRKENKLDEAVSILRAFVDSYPNHPLLSGGLTSLAATLEEQGKTDEALDIYQKVSTTYSTSFSTPIALLAQARISKTQNKIDEAKRLYDQVINQFPETPFAQQAQRDSGLLKK